MTDASASGGDSASPTATAPPHLSPSERTRIRRMPSRASYEREAVEAILDEGMVAHLGFAVDGQPYVIPTLYARVGDEVYMHGSAASRTLRALRAGALVCLTVTLLDGVVLARSAAKHSVNYRSVVIFGVARPIPLAERGEAMRAFTERLLTGRWDEVRAPSEKELKAIDVLALSLAESSAKVRSGPPHDEEEDYELDCWAGVIPMRLNAGTPLPDERLREGIAPPPSIDGWTPQRA